MKICKIDWKIYNKEFIDKFIKKNPNVNLNEVLFNSLNNSFILKENNVTKVLGCTSCLSNDVWQNDEGDIAVGNLVLLNLKNLSIEKNLPLGNTVAQDLSNNIWICPNCNRWIFDFLPKYDTMSIARS